MVRELRDLQGFVEEDASAIAGSSKNECDDKDAVTTSRDSYENAAVSSDSALAVDQFPVTTRADVLSSDAAQSLSEPWNTTIGDALPRATAQIPQSFEQRFVIAATSDGSGLLSIPESETKTIGSRSELDHSDGSAPGQKNVAVGEGPKMAQPQDDYPDENDSDSDGAESIFSQDSLASTVTSLGGLLQSSDVIAEITAAVFCNVTISPIAASALQDPDIDADRLRRNVRRMIKIFGKDLKIEAHNSLQKSAAHALQTRRISTHTAHAIVIHVNASTEVQPSSAPISQEEASTTEHARDQDEESDASVASADEEDEEHTPQDQNAAHIRDFLLDSDAYSAFKVQLLDFAHKPYEKRITQSLGTMVINESGKEYSPQAILVLAQEISWVHIHLFHFFYSEYLSFGNFVKGLLEDATGDAWNWWPLGRRQRRLRAGFCRLSWTTPHGAARYVDIQEHAMFYIQEAFKTAPAFINVPKPSKMHSRPKMQARPLGERTAVESVRNTARAPLLEPRIEDAAANASPSESYALHPLPSIQTPSPTSDQQSDHQVEQPRPADQHLYLFVHGSEPQFFSIDCSNLETDIQLFDKIRSEYEKARGWARLRLSMWHYGYCDFFVFQRFMPGRFARIKRAFPDDSNPLYDFVPRPPELSPPEGPISHDDFNSHYYHAKICPCLFSWNTWFHAACREDRIWADATALQAVPKRKVKLIANECRREYIFGLYAREELCAYMVLSYFALFNLPTMVFFAWYLCQAPGADLQNAVVPFTVSLMVSTGVLSWLYATK